MGNTIHFLVGRIGNNLDEAIDLLNKTSIDFKEYWQNKNSQGLSNTSETAIKNFDYIVNELLRERDLLASSTNTQYVQDFKDMLKVSCGKILTNITSSDLSAISPYINLGNATIAAGSNTNTISLIRLLNKIKHRKQDFLNFRIDNNEHLLFIATDSFQREPSCIVEFSVSEFCTECEKLSNLIKNKVP